MKKISGLILIGLFMIACCSAAIAAKPKASVVKPDPVVQSQQKEDLSDFKDDMNSALSDLKGQIDKVKSDNNDAKVGGVIFFNFQNYLQNAGANLNGFNVERAYVDFKKKLDGGAAVRVTLDVARISTALDAAKTSQQLYNFLKYAYVELPILDNSTIGITGKLGLQQTVWIDWADKILNLRYIVKSLVDNEGVMSSADFGVGAAGKLKVGTMPDVEYQATYLNGSGYKNAEADNKKNFGLRLNSNLLDFADNGKLILGVWGQAIGMTNDLLTGTTKQTGALLAFKHSLGTVYGEYLYGTGISGYSVGAVCQLMQKWNAFVRMDNYDPNRDKANDQLDRSFYGVTYDWNKDVKLALDVQNVAGGSAAATSAGKATSIIFLHSMIAY